MLHVNSMGYLEPGTVLTGNYEYQVISEVGRGSMAVVYLARQIDLERPVAVKVLSSELASNTSFVLRFFNEVRTAASLSHPNIIQAYDAGIANGDIYYFAMEYVKGETLLRRILREGHLEIAPALKYATEIASALNYGWQRQRLTHGDIKPENIMVNDLDQAKLADFGLAKVTGHEYEGHELMLTPHYASPELIKGQRPKEDCRADIYAFGASLYHLLAGRPPFPGNDGHEVMKRHLQEPVEPLYLRCPGVRPELSDFIGRMLEKNPEGRPADWMAVLKGLEECSIPYKNKRSGKSVAGTVRLPRQSGNIRIAPVRRSDSSVPVMQPRVRKQSRGGLWLSIVLALAFVLLLFFGYLYWRRHLHKRFDVKIQQAVQGNQVEATGSPEIPPAASVQAAPSAASVSAGDVPTPKAPMPGAKEALVATGDNADPSPEERVSEAAASPNEAAVLPEEVPDESPAPAVVPESPVASSASLPIHPDYSLSTVLTVSQRRLASEIQAWFLLASFQHVPGQPGSAEKMMRLLEQWLQANPAANSFSELIEFVRQSVVPFLDEGLSSLFLNKGVLLGQTFSGRNNLKVTVLDVLPEGLSVDLVLEKGTMRRKMTWREVMDAQLLLELYRVAFFEAKVNGKPELYLAQLLFSRNSKAFQAAMQKYSAAGGAKSSLWEELGKRVNLSERDNRALKDFADLVWICQQGGSRFEAAKIARRLLLNSNNPFDDSYKELLEAVLLHCEEFQPDIRGGRLVREAQELLPDKPDEALARLMTAQFLSGQIKYPEKTQIATLQGKAIESLASLPAYQTNFHQSFQGPFLSGSPYAAWPFHGLAWAGQLRMQAECPEDLQKTALLLAHLEAGNWHEVSGKENQLAPESLSMEAPEAALPAVLYGRSLLRWRNGDEQSAWQDELLRLYQLSFSGQLAPDAKALLFEYAVLSRLRLNKAGREMLLSFPDEFWLGGNPDHLRCRIRIVLTALLENQCYQRAFEMNRFFLSQLKDQNGQGDLLNELNWLQKEVQAALRKNRMSKEAVPVAAKLPFSLRAGAAGSEYRFRLQLAALGALPLSGVADQQFLEFFAAHAKGWKLIGGDAIYDWLLRRVAWQVSAGDTNRAFQLCDQVLALQAPCLFAFYPRIQFLRGALLCRNGQTAILTDIFFLLRNCTAASELEKRLLKVADNKVQVSRPGTDEPPYYWRDLLWFCFQAGTGSPSTASWEYHNGFAAENVLHRALTGASKEDLARTDRLQPTRTGHGRDTDGTRTDQPD